VAKALMDGQMLDAHFSRSFYKHILGIPVTYHDLETIDPVFYRSMQQILDLDLDEVDMGLVFTVDDDGMSSKEIELVPGGEEIDVREANKLEYVQLVAHHRMTSSIRDQTKAFLHGFFEVAPRDLVSMFTESELELMICGLPDIDIEDLRSHTVYQGFRATDQVVRWFWSILESFDDQDKARFIMFATGTSKVPLEGFKALQGTNGTQLFTITRVAGGDDRLPSSHTCFNSIDLPGGYKSKEVLKKRLLFAVREGSEGFGMA
jgi:E3 ubiquitin-protein ligase HUWE1